MGIFLDSGFFIGLAHPDDVQHHAAVRILKTISTGEFGLIYTSSFVIAEAATVLLVRTNMNLKIIEKLYFWLYGERKIVEILPWKRAQEEKSWELFLRHNHNVETKRKMLSFVDATSIILCQEFQIASIVAFDGDFDPYLHRET